MRVIAGTLGGRQFASPGSFKTHPMSDKMRGALFNILGDIEGLHVLDAFGGSGALSFEAVSRGAASAVVIDQDKAAQRCIASNIAALNVGDRVRLIAASVSAWLHTSEATVFNVVLCDPPYNDPQPALLERLAGCVTPGGLYILSYPSDKQPPVLPTLERIKQQHYGDGMLYFYRKLA